MRITSIIFFIVFSLRIATAGDGVEFLTGDYDMALEQALEQQKFVLLDFTASWCLPCKKMDLETFPDTSLGSFVNQHFVSFKVNTDHASGKALAKQFKVKAYPTILILDEKQRIVRRLVGFQSASKLLRELEPLSGLQPSNSDH
jgi:thiol:disulfide interchange protein